MKGFSRRSRRGPYVAVKPIHGIILFVVTSLFVGALPRPVCAEPYGNSGGVRNEGDTGVSLLMTDSTGDYQWDYLAAGTSLDFPENTSKVGFHESALSPVTDGGLIRIVVFFPEGTRKEVKNLGEEVFLVERKDKLR